jgi:alpha-beta hydrolase superfamily lysophospholipase
VSRSEESIVRVVRGLLTHVARTVVYGAIGGLVVLVVLLVIHLEGRPDLKVWHTVRLDAEFTEDGDVERFTDYLALEDRLFAQLDERVYHALEPGDRSEINRYSAGSLSDPGRWPRNWNRSFELSVAEPRVGVLLVHGMSDSPYSMRSLGEQLHAEGAHVIGLRVPGHGTAPSGLVHARWQDMAAAVRLAMVHLGERVDGAPLWIVGYSNGGALAVQYALTALEDDRLPMPSQLILLSPEIGITRFAALAVWQERLGHLLGLHKLAWNSIQPEYDPYKYGSFALNAGKQAYLVTQEIQSRIIDLGASGELRRFPPTLAFQSVVDATVAAPDLVSALFDRLPRSDHELVLFDINRFTHVETLLRRRPDAWLRDMLEGAGNSFTVTVLMNRDETSRDVVLRRRKAGETSIGELPLDLHWPRGVYSLSHVALPFPPDDPLYGGPAAKPSPGIQLGNVALRGERGVLQVGAADMLRLHWNPFHAYIEHRMSDLVTELEPTPPRR